MATVLEELVTVLGFEIDDTDLQAYQQSMEGLEQTLKKVALAGVAAGAALSAFVGIVASATDRQFKFAQAAGSSFQDLQRIGHAAGIAGASVDDVEAAFARLNALTSQMARGQIPEAFAFLGITGTDAVGNLKTSKQLFDEIADRIAAMSSDQERADFAGALGFSTEMLLLLRMGSQEIGRLGAEVDAVGALISDKQGRDAENFMDAMLRLRLALRGIANTIAIFLMPVMEDAAQAFFVWATANRELIHSGLEKWLVVLTSAIRPLMIFFGMLLVAIAAITVALVGWPAVIAAAAVAALASLSLWVDELWGYFHGEDSIIGRIGAAWTELWDVTIPAAVDKGWAAIKSKLDPIDDFFLGWLPGFGDSGGGLAPGGAGGFTPSPPAFAGASFIGAGGNRSLHQENVFHINSTDPAGAGREVSGVQDDLYRKAASEFRAPEVS